MSEYLKAIDELTKLLQGYDRDNLAGTIDNLVDRLNEIWELDFLDHFLDISNWSLDRLIEESCHAKGLIEIAEMHAHEAGYESGYESAKEDLEADIEQANEKGYDAGYQSALESPDIVDRDLVEGRVDRLMDFLTNLNLEKHIFREIKDYLKHYPIAE